MTSEQSATKFWLIVQACLVEIYGMSTEAACKEVRRLSSRRTKHIRTAYSTKDVTYHSQPIHVASDIALGDSPMSDDVWRRYQDLLNRFENTPKLLTRKLTKSANAQRAAKPHLPEKLLASR